MRMRLPNRLILRRAMYIDIALHAVHVAEPVNARLETREPQDARQYPVAIRMLPAKLRRPYLASRTTPDEYGIDRHICANFGAHHMFAARRAVTVLFFPHSV